ncbi:hypothetical protein CB1_001326031 [Camelus ferus]|nr:hypothetical protein CB1_001326031 [Camelus ferus]
MRTWGRAAGERREGTLICKKHSEGEAQEKVEAGAGDVEIITVSAVVKAGLTTEEENVSEGDWMQRENENQQSVVGRKPAKRL